MLTAPSLILLPGRHSWLDRAPLEWMDLAVGLLALGTFTAVTLCLFLVADDLDALVQLEEDLID